MEIGAITTSNNKSCNFCKKGHLESECRQKNGTTSRSGSKPPNPNKGKTCNFCHKKGHIES
eukprot:9097265-Alexandrium_andersonii.AAC.1